MKEDSEMRNKVMNRISIMLAVVLIFMLALNAFGQDRRGESYSEGYGAHGMMGQDPE
jgi:hypothetical protein